MRSAHRARGSRLLSRTAQRGETPSGDSVAESGLRNEWGGVFRLATWEESLTITKVWVGASGYRFFLGKQCLMLDAG